MVEAIAYAKFLNKEFGMNVSAPDLLDENSKWDEAWLEHHLIYATVYGNPEVREKMQKHTKRFRDKGIFSAMYEMGGAQE